MFNINWQGWLKTHPGGELLSSVWPDPINWQGGLNTYPECESLSNDQISSTDKVNWTPIQRVSPSPVWSYQLIRLAKHPSRMWVASSVWPNPINWLVWLNTHPAGESLSSSWPDPINWLGWLNMQWVSLCCFWPDPINWQGWLNTHPGCELLSSVWLPSTD